MVVVDLKEEARKFARTKRAKAHAAGTRDAMLACELLLGFLRPSFGQVVAGYMPIHTEIDPRPAMTRLSEQGAVCVPEVVQDAAPLRFLSWAPDTPMVEGRFGADVPKDGTPVIPDIVIVPLLAFNRDGHRLGYGGGYYDRTLAGLRAAGRVKAIGLAYAGQEMADFPVSSLDAPLDVIVTEAEVLTF